jgi:hypothetical protein
MASTRISGGPTFVPRRMAMRDQTSLLIDNRRGFLEKLAAGLFGASTY